MGGKDVKQEYGLPLTPRQLEILNLVKLGNKDEAIGLVLGISGQAVANRISHGILPRLGAVNRTHAVYIAMKQGSIK